jgi:hypothetical protein
MKTIVSTFLQPRFSPLLVLLYIHSVKRQANIVELEFNRMPSRYSKYIGLIVELLSSD